MEGIVYLLVRMACIFYLLYKVWCWKSRVDEICRLLYGKGAETGAETPVECPKDTGTEDVMGSTRFVYLDEDAGTGVAPYMSQPLEQGTDYIGEDEEIREEDVECLLPLEEMELLRKEQEELDNALPETEVITQAVTLEEFSLVGDVLMRVNGADQDADKRSSAARTLFAIRNTSLFDLFISQVGNEEAVNKLLEENLDEDGNPRPLKKEGKRNNGGVDWRELV